MFEFIYSIQINTKIMHSGAPLRISYNILHLVAYLSPYITRKRSKRYNQLA